jgi:NAD(P)-dependent dehydrogenase (short-subunit alcohol dehydrogenase family)
MFPHTPLFDHAYRALIVGASGAIGAAFVHALKQDPYCQYLHTVSRQSTPGFDLMDEGSIREQAERAHASGPYHLIVDATGALTLDGQGPEKSLSQLSQATLMKAMGINAIGPILVLKHFSGLLAPGSAIYAKLSARVGSISDNQLGGWYGYRASKAALNMYLQTAAIELQRRQPQWQIVALQPGTVDSALSRPFQANVRQLLTPEASVQGMLTALKTLSPKKGAHFIDHRGQDIPW